MPTYKPTAADARVAHAAQVRAQRADNRARRLATRADAALAEEEAACAAYRAATSRALAARCTADTARIDADRVITIYLDGVSAKDAAACANEPALFVCAGCGTRYEKKADWNNCPHCDDEYFYVG